MYTSLLELVIDLVLGALLRWYSFQSTCISFCPAASWPRPFCCQRIPLNNLLVYYILEVFFIALTNNCPCIGESWLV